MTWTSQGAERDFHLFTKSSGIWEFAAENDTWDWDVEIEEEEEEEDEEEEEEEEEEEGEYDTSAISLKYRVGMQPLSSPLHRMTPFPDS